jgi:hypothetical protein
MFGIAVEIRIRIPSRHRWNTTVRVEASGERGICVCGLNMRRVYWPRSEQFKTVAVRDWRSSA